MLNKAWFMKPRPFADRRIKTTSDAEACCAHGSHSGISLLTVELLPRHGVSPATSTNIHPRTRAHLHGLWAAFPAAGGGALGAGGNLRLRIGLRGASVMGSLKSRLEPVPYHEPGSTL